MRLFLLALLAVFGLGCQVRPVVTTAPVPEPIPVVEPVNIDKIVADRGRFWTPSQEYAIELGVMILDGGMQIQPIIAIDHSQMDKTESDWAFVKSQFPFQLDAATLDPIIVRVDAQDIATGDVLSNRLRAEAVMQKVGVLEERVLPVLYWDVQEIGMNDLRDRSTGLFVRKPLSVLAYDVPREEEFIFLQWMLAVHQ